jgi:crotonobetainyl-CoA:carnitine CoA-transferase CaiB-like acyl-CoA transferase
MIAWQLAGGPVARAGSRRARSSPVCVVACAEPDSWLAVAVDSDAAWAALSGVVGGDPGLTLAQRIARADEMEAAIAEWARTRAPADAAQALQAAGVTAAPVQCGHALTYDPQLEAAGFWATMQRRYVGSHLIGAAPFAYDGVRPPLSRPAPTLGEHTAEVLAER